MNPFTRAFRALPFTFMLYVFEAGLSALCALPFALELARRLGVQRWDAFQDALALDSLAELAPTLRVSLGSLLVCALLLRLLSPWLQTSWLLALTDTPHPLRALAEGARRTLRAWLVSLWVLLGTLFTCAPFALIGYALHAPLSKSTDARFHDLALYAALVPMLPTVLFALVVHDLARARALRHGALRSLQPALLAAMHAPTLLRGLGFTALGYVLVLSAQWLSLGLPAGGSRFLLVASTLQAALLCRLFLRSVWLAHALACMHPELPPVAAEL